MMKTLTQIETEINDKLDLVIAKLPVNTIAGEVKDMLRQGVTTRTAIFQSSMARPDYQLILDAVPLEGGIQLRITVNGQVVAWEGLIPYGEKRWQ